MILVLVAALLAVNEDPPIVDLTKASYKVDIFTDGQGHYVAVDRLDPASGQNDVHHSFYGDGKTFHDSDLRGGTVNSDEPRYPNGPSLYSRDDTSLRVTCGERVSVLKPVTTAERDAMIAKAVFKRSLVDYRPYALSRDDKGVYYYAARGRFSDNENSFKVYVGPRGGMKEQKLTNIVHDSVGDIFATAKGDLRLITGNPNRTEWWKGTSHSVLTDVPIWQNLQLIFNDLGPYKRTRLGTPCDDL